MSYLVRCTGDGNWSRVGNLKVGFYRLCLGFASFLPE